MVWQFDQIINHSLAKQILPNCSFDLVLKSCNELSQSELVSGSWKCCIYSFSIRSL